LLRVDVIFEFFCIIIITANAIRSPSFQSCKQPGLCENVWLMFTLSVERAEIHGCLDQDSLAFFDREVNREFHCDFMIALIGIFLTGPNTKFTTGSVFVLCFIMVAVVPMRMLRLF